MNHAATAGALACLYRRGMHSTKPSAIWQKYHITITKDIKVPTRTCNANKSLLRCNVRYIITLSTLVWRWTYRSPSEQLMQRGRGRVCWSAPGWWVSRGLWLHSRNSVWTQWQSKLVPPLSLLDPAAVGDMCSDKLKPLWLIGWLALFLLCFMWRLWNSKICGWFGMARMALNCSFIYLFKRNLFFFNPHMQMGLFFLHNTCQSNLFLSELQRFSVRNGPPHGPVY